jgi:hypothetical protein
MTRVVILRWLANGVVVRLVVAALLLSLAAAGPARAGRETIAIPVTEPQPATITGDRFVSIAKGGKGATVEYNPNAHEDSERQVKQFLAAQLKARP